MTEEDVPTAHADQCPDCGTLYTGHGMDPPPYCGHQFGRYEPVVVAALSRVPADGEDEDAYVEGDEELGECGVRYPGTVPADGERPPKDPRMAATLDSVEVHEGVLCVEMPCCGFTFDVNHVDVGTEWLYSCPLCSPADGPVSGGLTAEEADVAASLLEATPEGTMSGAWETARVKLRRLASGDNPDG